MSPHIIQFSMSKKEKQPKLFEISSYGIFSKELKNEFETAAVNEPSVFEPLIYCVIIGRCCLLLAST